MKNSNKENLIIPPAPEIRRAKPLGGAKRANCTQFAGLSPDRGFRARSHLPTLRNAPRSAALFLLVAFAFCSFSSFSDDLPTYLDSPSAKVQYTVYIANESGSFDDSGFYYSGSPSGVLGYIQSNWIGLSFYSDTSELYRPQMSASFGSQSYTRPFYSSSFTNQYYSFYYFPKVRSYFSFVGSVYSLGYRGPALEILKSNSSYAYLNFNFSVFVNDVLFGTNTLFKSTLLGYLSSLSQSVQNIDLNTSGLRASIDSGNTILSSIDSSTSNSLEVLFGINTNVLALSSVPSLLSSSLDSLSLLHDDFTLSNIDVALGDDTSSWSDFLDWSVSKEYLNRGTANNYLAALIDTDPVRGSKAASNSLRRSIVKNQIKTTVLECVRLRGRYQSILSPDIRDGLQNQGRYFTKSFRDDVVDLSSARTSQLNDWRDQVRQQLQDWKTDLKSDLQAWKTSDETGYLNIRQAIDDNFNRNFTTSEVASTNRLPFTAYVTNYVTRIVTNSIEQSSADIQSNATSNVDRQIQGDEDRWNEFKRITTGNGEGLNVKVKFPLWESDGYHVNVRDDGVIQAIQDGITIVNPDLTDIRDSWDSFMEMYSPTNSLDWDPWFEKWVPFSEVVTNYYAEFNESAPASEIAADFLYRGFDVERYSALPWFERVEVLLAMIADVRSNSVDVADIQQDMERQVSDFQTLSTNIVSVSGDVVGLFGYVQRFSSSLQSMFGDRAAPLTGDYVLLSAGHWIGDEPLVLRINPTIQNLCRLIMQCIWYLGFLVLLWVVVNWCWQKVVAVLRWLWSMFDV